MGYYKDYRDNWAIYIPKQREMLRPIRRRAQINTQAGARLEYESLMAQLFATGVVTEQREQPPVAVATLTVDEFWKRYFVPIWIPKHCRPSTAERYASIYANGIGLTFGVRPLDEISAADVMAFEADLARRPHRVGGAMKDGIRIGGRVKKIGVHARPHVALLRSIFKAAVAFQILKQDEVPRFELPPKPEPLPEAPSADDVALLISGADGFLRVAIALGYYAGLRMGEIRELRIKDVTKGRITINRALSGSRNAVRPPKSGKGRSIRVVPELRAILDEAARGRDRDETFCVTVNDRVPSRQYILTAFQRLCRACGIRVWSFHSTRHAFASELLRRGVGAETVRRLGGWSKLEVVQRYAHATHEDLDRAVGKLSESESQPQ